jgi:hypothetical protein
MLLEEGNSPFIEIHPVMLVKMFKMGPDNRITLGDDRPHYLPFIIRLSLAFNDRDCPFGQVPIQAPRPSQ